MAVSVEEAVTPRPPPVVSVVPVAPRVVAALQRRAGPEVVETVASVAWVEWVPRQAAHAKAATEELVASAVRAESLPPEPTAPVATEAAVVTPV